MSNCQHMTDGSSWESEEGIRGVLGHCEQRNPSNVEDPSKIYSYLVRNFKEVQVGSQASGAPTEFIKFTLLFEWCNSTLLLRLHEAKYTILY